MTILYEFNKERGLNNYFSASIYNNDKPKKLGLHIYSFWHHVSLIIVRKFLESYGLFNSFMKKHNLFRHSYEICKDDFFLSKQYQFHLQN